LEGGQQRNAFIAQGDVPFNKGDRYFSKGQQLDSLVFSFSFLFLFFLINLLLFLDQALVTNVYLVIYSTTYVVRNSRRNVAASPHWSELDFCIGSDSTAQPTLDLLEGQALQPFNQQHPGSANNGLYSELSAIDCIYASQSVQLLTEPTFYIYTD
jgi:hypothetical protein